MQTISSPARVAGLFFCLASDTVQGFYFVLLQYSHIQAFTAAFVLSMQLYLPRRKTAHRALQRIFLRFDPFYHRRYQTDTINNNAACATLERITAPQHLQHVPDTTTTPATV